MEDFLWGYLSDKQYEENNVTVERIKDNLVEQTNMLRLFWVYNQQQSEK